ncbi:helix-turn-helix transcriptional regulator [Luteimonas viscosa]|uniref:Helix-turn-helix transcriptional regulator n=1 Tax=Luteimonas viscosa TaxID=1132694 RepID=A0A5D4XTF0_9GAMM|nr:helix-turn-helix transcriptional regulator [Luteimonas viscosa]TYT27275.1 helix-turn-helix transcriptional regulator [Luteimonas viscosa]
MKLSTRIRTARVRAGMSQADLAGALGVSRSAVGNWESAKGRVFPSTERLSELAMATGVSYEWLATGRGAPQAPSDGIPAADAEFVDDPVERRLLEAFRACNEQFKQAILTVLEAQAPQRPRRPRPGG